MVRKFEDLCENNRDDSDVTGIRYINGGRYELFLGAKGNQLQQLNGLWYKQQKRIKFQKQCIC